MTRYSSILKKDIRKFVTNTQYRSLAELQSNASRREIELETQVREGEKESHIMDKRPIPI